MKHYVTATYAHPIDEDLSETRKCLLCYDEDQETITVLDEDKHQIDLEEEGGYTDFPFISTQEWQEALEELESNGGDATTLIFG